MTLITTTLDTTSIVHHFDREATFYSANAATIATHRQQ